MGQGALILGDPKAAVGNPFFLLAPGWAQVPLVFLAATADGDRLAGRDLRGVLA